MKFLVTCLDDDMKTRVLASKTKVFDACHKAILYGAGIAVERVASVVPVPSDVQHAAEFVFDHMVEKHPECVEDPEELKAELRYEQAGEDLMIVFTPGDGMASAFNKSEFLDFTNEIERLVLGGDPDEA